MAVWAVTLEMHSQDSEHSDSVIAAALLSLGVGAQASRVPPGELNWPGSLTLFSSRWRRSSVIHGRAESCARAQ